MSGQEGPTLISSVQRAFRLMEAVGAHESGVPAKQLARETGLALGTTYHLLRTMVHDGYVRKLEDGTFVLGERLGALHAGSRDQTALSRVRPTLTELRDDLSAAAYLTLYEEGEIRVAEIVDGPKAPGWISGSASRTRDTPRRSARACCASWMPRPAPTTSPATR